MADPRQAKSLTRDSARVQKLRIPDQTAKQPLSVQEPDTPVGSDTVSDGVDLGQPGDTVVNSGETKSVVIHHPPLLLTRRVTAQMGKKPILAYLSYYAKTTGAANTAFASAYALQPNLDSSFASWQNTFDEMRVVGAECHWKVYVLTNASANPAQSPATVCVYDPTNLTNLASVNAGLQYEKFQLLSCPINTSAPSASAPQPTTKTGLMVLKVKVPGGVQSSAASTLLSTGQWRPTDDASNYYWGNYQMYTSVGGTSCVLQTEAFIRMAVEFRVRR